MRFVVYGAGAVGGVVGAKLHQAGHDVLLIARGPHLTALQASGLKFLDDQGEHALAIPAVAAASEVCWGPDDVILLCVKSQDTDLALSDLARSASAQTPVVCLQNGVSNEPKALRLFSNVYGVCVNCPVDHPGVGVVETLMSPIVGVLDIGRFPAGVDDLARLLSAALRACGFASAPLPSVMAWKYSKLLLNLANAAKIALTDPLDLAERAALEGELCLAAAGIEAVSTSETIQRRRAVLVPRADGGATDELSWRLRQDRTWAAEADYLNGEIVLLGRLWGVATPVNASLQALARLVVLGAEPASLTYCDVTNATL